MRMTWRLVLLAVSALSLMGCQSSLYEWGDYQGAVYRMYCDPHGYDPNEEITQLNRLISDADADGLKVGPGVHAHLGFLLYSAGDVEMAGRHFRTEITLFPESEVFLTGMLKRMGQ